MSTGTIRSRHLHRAAREAEAHRPRGAGARPVPGRAQAVNPKSAMPDLGVTEADARDIAAYLAGLR
jgi:hypothetical protein